MSSLNYMDWLPDEIVNYIHNIKCANIIISVWNSYNEKRHISNRLLQRLNTHYKHYVPIPYAYNLLLYSFKFVKKHDKNTFYKKVLLKTVNSLVENEDLNGPLALYYSKIETICDTLVQQQIIKCK